MITGNKEETERRQR